VQLRNAAGQTAGPSEAVFAASGLAPAEVEGLRATAGKAGAMLEWRAGSSALAASSGGTESVEVSRVRVDGPANPTGAAKSKSSAGVMGTAKDSANAQFRVSWSADLSGASSDSARHGDPGGAVDRSAKTGEMYRYTVERVWTFELGGHTLELRSRVSPPQTVAMLDIFAPDAPAGLVTSPAYAGGGEAGKTRKPAIDLSWEPGTEARIAGYIVFRRDLDGSAPDAVRRVNPELAVMPSYRDATVEGGKRYAYRVSAVDGAGNVSAPGNEVVESAPGQ
jgi:hypothetical protein